MAGVMVLGSVEAVETKRTSIAALDGMEVGWALGPGGTW